MTSPLAPVLRTAAALRDTRVSSQSLGGVGGRTDSLEQAGLEAVRASETKERYLPALDQRGCARSVGGLERVVKGRNWQHNAAQSTIVDHTSAER